MVGSNLNNPQQRIVGPPLWLLAELTYSCPLQCPYCSNPMDIANYKDELSTDEWLKVLRDARKMGSTQLGFSGGEPLVRKDLEILIKESRELGYYTNLITSGVGMDGERIAGFKEAGLDHIQVSFQASDEELNNFIGGTDSFKHKLEMAREVKRQGYPMVLNFVLHRQNTDKIGDIIELAIALEADYLELATTQYYGWANHNKELLLPTRTQIEKAEKIAHQYQDKLKNKMRIYYIVPDYFEDRPKPCMNGWGNVFLTVTPDGTALPCHSARTIPSLDLPNVKDHSIDWIWSDSPDFNKFRGYEWMKEPCRSCDEKEKDFGGCRCQALMLTGDAANTDPVCSKSPNHGKLVEDIRLIEEGAMHKTKNKIEEKPLVFRNMRASKKLSTNS